MFKIIKDFKKIIEELHKDPVVTDLSSYNRILKDSKEYSYKGMPDSVLKEVSAKLAEKAGEGIESGKILAEAFGLVNEAVQRVLGIVPYEVQLLAGIAMQEGKLVEMQTGEGKTVAAVFPAYLRALYRKGVHVLTFNDYLAKRDAEWMGPVYMLLGLTVGYITEGMPAAERKKAYGCDITYLTAKEAGFDYLRDCLAFEKEEMVHRPFHFAIIDEADSILIDEARIPIVIAGNVPAEEDIACQMAEVVRVLKPGRDYAADEYGRNVNLTEAGVNRVEAMVGCGNLYEEENLPALTAVNSALHAEVLLKKDVDYVVRDGILELVDEFTGRIADKRHWPDGLQAAIEAKEGIRSSSKGRILGSITLKNFLGQYPGICGMTATARTSAQELMEFYGLEVVIIPPNRPSARVDDLDVVFANKEDKYRCILEEVKQVHTTGRPILLGTASIEESAKLADLLQKEGIFCSVLNAKNDALEAEIIARAGEYGAVTVSTNMAGRGTDIKLGGVEEKDRDRVVALGGLYVIGANRNESRRIDNQLRGRAGRQGDPGSSRFFISLEDDLIKKYGIDKVIPEQFMIAEEGKPLGNKVVYQKILHIQKLIEGQNFDIRRTLCKYSFMLEEQRRIVQRRRKAVLLGEEPLTALADGCTERYHRVRREVGEEVVNQVEKYLTLFHIDRCWADHLEYAAYVQDGIHLVSIAGKNPLDEFHTTMIAAFESLNDRVNQAVVETFHSIRVSKEGADFEGEGLKRPTSTWTYLVSDDYFINNLGMKLLGAGMGLSSVVAAMSGGLMVGTLLYERFFKKKK